mmetsp:Transcript_67811/g.162761  ORF Transcript_67811/g.162761 Transcript_67811/m.162761 type:complete len:1235 (+) Transcript_67811:197-3901(+)
MEEVRPLRQPDLTTHSSIGNYGTLTSSDEAPIVTSKALSPEAAKKGLSSDEAARRLELYGPNELDDVPKKGFFYILALQLLNLIFLLTTTAAIICYATGDATKGTFLVCLVCIVCLLNAIGEYSGQDAGAALKAMGTATAMVKRDNAVQSIPTPEMVPGDVVQIKIGDVIAADMELIECVDIQCNEATLTGEAKEVTKTLEAVESETAFPTNMVYKSTSCVSGSGWGFVTRTGMSTQVGLIAKRLKDTPPKEDDPRKERKSIINPIQRSINLLGQRITMGCLLYISAGTIASYLMRYQSLPPRCARMGDDACMLRESIIRGLLMAVALIPHGLPLVVMIMLRIAAHVMATHSAIVSRMSAVDYLGATNVICTDKTGTLTEGRMAAKTLVGMCREASGKSSATLASASFYPLRGLNPQGGCFASDELSATKFADLDKMPLARRSIATDAGSSQLQNIADNRQAVEGPTLPAALMSRVNLGAASLGCYSVVIKQKPDGGWEAEGNMSEAALKVAAYKGFLEDGSAEAAELHERHKRFPELEVAFSSSRKMSATVHALPEDKTFQSLVFDKSITHFAILKGAPDRVLPSLSTLVEVGKDKKLHIADSKLSNEERQMLQEANDSLARQALRSLLMSLRPLADADVKALSSMASADERLTFLKGRGQLCFLGLFGIYDPPRESVPPSIKECHEAGIRVVMITGDQRETALAIGKVVGIIEEGANDADVARACADLHEDAVVARSPNRRKLSSQQSFTLSTHDIKKKQDSHEVEFKSTEEVAEMTSKVAAWSRALPSDKVTIVESLGKQGYITSMTGDGVNDAPALKKADVGVSMGITGTEVTKNAASLVLMDDNFSTIVAAVAEGRRIYGNVQKYVVFNLSVKLSECTSMLVAIFFGLPMPIQGLAQLVNLVATHIVPPIALAWEAPEEYSMRTPPRKTGEDLILTRTHFFFRIVPFFTVFAAMVTGLLACFTWMQVGYVHVHSIVGSTVAGAISRHEAACEFAGTLDDNGDFQRDAAPYHCVCEVRNSPLQETPNRMDQWGIANPDDIVMDRYSGDTGNALMRENSPWAGSGFAEMLEVCMGMDGQHMCWKDPGIAKKPLLSVNKNCAIHGSKIATTMSYASIALAEIAALATHRTDGFYVFARPSAAYMGVLVFNLSILAVVLYWQWLNEILELAPLDLSHFRYCLIAPVLMVSASEIIKMVYRPVLQQDHDNDWMAHRGEKVPLKAAPEPLPEGKV